MVAGRNAGYSLKEIDELDIAYLLDLLITQGNALLKNQPKKDGPRKATQADIDML